MLIRNIALATAGAAMFSTTAIAGSLAEPVVEPVLAPAPYVAPVTGGDWTGAYGGVSLGYADVETSAGTNGDGAIGGVTLGYDYDFGNFVLGTSVDYDFADIDVGGTTLENVARLKVRGGYDLGNGLVYATAGAAQAYTDNLGDDTGYFAGVGYEHKLTNAISVGGEVLYHEFEDFNGSGTTVEATTAQIKMNYRF